MFNFVKCFFFIDLIFGEVKRFYRSQLYVSESFFISSFKKRSSIVISFIHRNQTPCHSFPTLSSQQQETNTQMVGMQRKPVCVCLFMSISRAKKIHSTEKFKNHKNVLKHLSLSLSSNSINFFHKAQNFVTTKTKQTSRPGVASCTINLNSAILCWLQFLNLKP